MPRSLHGLDDAGNDRRRYAGSWHSFATRGWEALLDVQAAWHQGMLDASLDELQPLYETYPPLYGKLVGRRFEKMVSDSVMQRLDRDEKREARRARAQRR